MKKRKLRPNIPNRLLNVPLLIAPAAADALLNVLNKGSFPPDEEALYLIEVDSEEGSFQGPEGIAVIPVLGGLSHRGYGWWWRLTYAQIREEFNEAINDPSVKAIVFDMDSPGGEVAGLFDLVDLIYSARSKKPIYSILNDDALSAAYGIASAAEKVFISRTSMAGSVGVISIFMDQSKHDAEEGLKYTAIYAGEHKADFNPHEPLKKNSREWLQQSVNKTWEMFIATVARNRGLTQDDIRNMQAGIFEGQSALDMGLADEILPWDEALEVISAQITTTKQGGIFFMGLELKDLKQGLAAFLKENPAEGKAMLAENGFVEKPADPPAQPVAAAAPANPGNPEHVDLDKVRTDARAEGAAAEKARVSGITELCTLAGMSDKSAEYIKAGKSVDDVRKDLLAARAEAGDKDTIISATTPLGGEANPLLVDAKRRAEAATKR